MTMRWQRWPVWLYVPNLIGYARIAFCIYAFAHYNQPWKFFWYYSLGFVLDGVDGLAARALGQTSRLGAQLDMVTDRCGTAALLTVLATHYPRYAALCYGLVFLDGYSHWVQIVAGELAGAASHKLASKGRLLALYYWRPILTIVCFLNEACLIALYMKAFTSGAIIFASLPVFDFILSISAPVCILKQIVSLRQIFSGHETIVDVLA